MALSQSFLFLAQMLNIQYLLGDAVETREHLNSSVTYVGWKQWMFTAWQDLTSYDMFLSVFLLYLCVSVFFPPQSNWTSAFHFCCSKFMSTVCLLSYNMHL